MAASYATAEEYATWSGEPAPTDIARLLARATELIDSIVTASFLVDEETGLPVDEDVALALRDATCAQVRFWVEVGHEHDIDGLAGSAFAVGGFSGKRAPKTAPQAVRILRGASLL